MITKQLSAEYTLMDSDQEGKIVVKASSFGNEDVYGDIFEQGAFDDDISRINRKNRLPMLWQHKSDEPIGNWYKLWKDDTYLYMEGQLTRGVPQAERAYLNMKAGDIKGVSIGFNVIESDTRRDSRGDYEGLNFQRVALMENSIVTFPANSMAEMTELRSLPQQREFERLLIHSAREAGIEISRRDVEKMVNGVWPSLKQTQTDERDAEGEDSAKIWALIEQL